MAKKKKTAAAAADTQTESAAAAAPMTPEQSAPATPARMRVQFKKRCEVIELRCVFTAGSVAVMDAARAERYAASGFVRILCPVL